MPIQRMSPRMLSAQIPADKIPNIPASNMPSGTIIQSLQSISRDYGAAALGANGEYIWVSQSITRLRSDSKIQILFSGCYGTNSGNDTSINLYRDTTKISIGDNTGASRNNTTYSIGTDKGGLGNTSGSSLYFMIPCAISYIDTPTAGISEITYTVKIWVEASTTVYPNGDGWRGSGQQAHNTQANLILLETVA